MYVGVGLVQTQRASGAELQTYTPEDYEYDKNKIIKLSENNIKSKNGKNIYNKLWNIDTWDVCFSSSYGFANNKKG